MYDRSQWPRSGCDSLMGLTHVMGRSRAPSLLTCIVWLVRLEERATGDTNVVNLPPCISLNPLRLATQDLGERFSDPSNTHFYIDLVPNLVSSPFVQCQTLVEEIWQDGMELPNWIFLNFLFSFCFPSLLSNIACWSPVNCFTFCFFISFNVLKIRWLSIVWFNLILKEIVSLQCHVIFF